MTHYKNKIKWIDAKAAADLLKAIWLGKKNRKWMKIEVGNVLPVVVYYEKFICCNLSHRKLFRISSLSPIKFLFNSVQLQIYFDYALRYIDNSKSNGFVHRVSDHGKHSFWIALFRRDTQRQRQNFLFQCGMPESYLYFWMTKKSLKRVIKFV